MSWFKLILVCMLLFVILNLGRALFAMMKGNSDKPTSHFLGRRLMYSALIIVLLFVALNFGWITPNPRPY